MYKRIKKDYIKKYQYLNRPLFCIDIRAKVGLFAQFNWCLYILRHCQHNQLSPQVKLTGAFYAERKQDYLPLLLSTKVPQTKKPTRLMFNKVKHVSEIPLENANMLSLLEAHLLFFQYFDIEPQIRSYVTAFKQQNFSGKTLGVHLRGTDKYKEAQIKPDEFILNTIQNYLADNPDVQTIFIASDEQRYINLIQQTFNGLHVIFHPDTIKSIEGQAIHINTGHGQRSTKAYEAMVNCLLLAECDYLIKSASFLSAWACIFNPDLPVTLLSTPYSETLWFPDLRIAEKSNEKYVQ